MRTILVFISMFLSLSVSAIVVRHDIDKEKYLASPDDFNPLATFYVDGAHGTLIKPRWVVTAAHATFCVNSGSYISLKMACIKSTEYSCTKITSQEKATTLH